MQPKDAAKTGKDLPEKEVEHRRDAALKRALAMPPKEHAAKPTTPPAKKRKKASGS